MPRNQVLFTEISVAASRKRKNEQVVKTVEKTTTLNERTRELVPEEAKDDEENECLRPQDEEEEEVPKKKKAEKPKKAALVAEVQPKPMFVHPSRQQEQRYGRGEGRSDGRGDGRDGKDQHRRQGECWSKVCERVGCKFWHRPGQQRLKRERWRKA